LLSIRISFQPAGKSVPRTLVRYEQVKKKIRLLVEHPEMGKPLHAPLKGLWRVHIGHFVLVYEIDTKEKAIVLLRFVHHDEAYE